MKKTIKKAQEIIEKYKLKPRDKHFDEPEVQIRGFLKEIKNNLKNPAKLISF
jgi:hypothetical protein